MPPKFKKIVKRAVKKVKKQANNGVLYHDARFAADVGKAAGSGIIYASAVAASAGHPEVAAPLLVAGGATSLAAQGVNKLAKSGLLKKKKKKDNKY